MGKREMNPRTIGTPHRSTEALPSKRESASLFPFYGVNKRCSSSSPFACVDYETTAPSRSGGCSSKCSDGRTGREITAERAGRMIRSPASRFPRTVLIPSVFRGARRLESLGGRGRAARGTGAHGRIFAGIVWRRFRTVPGPGTGPEGPQTGSMSVMAIYQQLSNKAEHGAHPL